MKKGLLITALAICLMGTPAVAHALSFTLDQSQLIQLWGVFENPESTGLVSTYLGLKTAKSGGVEYIGQLYDAPGNTYSPFAQIGIGANFWGTSSTGSGATIAAIGANNLTGYTSYALTFENTNDDIWSVNLFLNTGWCGQGWTEPNTFYENGWTALNPGQSATLSLDLTSVGYLNHVTNIGFMVAGDMDQTGGNPSNPDTYKILVRPVPEPTSMLLLGIGLIGLAGGKIRKRFKA